MGLAIKSSLPFLMLTDVDGDALLLNMTDVRTVLSREDGAHIIFRDGTIRMVQETVPQIAQLMETNGL